MGEKYGDLLAKVWGFCESQGGPLVRMKEEQDDGNARRALRRRGLLLQHKTIPDAPHRYDLLCLRAEFLAQTGNMCIDGPIEPILVEAPPVMKAAPQPQRATGIGHSLQHYTLFFIC